MVAVKTNGTSIMRWLLERGADARQTNDKGETALLFAAKNNRADLARLLLEHKADATQVTVDGDTPLLAATKHDNIELMTLLLEHKVNVNQVKTPEKETPLFAATQNSTEAVQLLLEHKADATYSNGRNSVLNSACSYSTVDAVRSLLEHGADEKEEGLALIACDRSEAMTMILLDAGQDTEQVRCWSSLYSRALVKCMKYVLSKIFINRIGAGTFNLTDLVSERSTYFKSIPMYDDRYGKKYQTEIKQKRSLGSAYGITVKHFLPEYLAPHLISDLAKLVVDFMPEDEKCMVYIKNM